MRQVLKHITKGNTVMKYLKIDTGKGEFFNGTSYVMMDKLGKEDLWFLARMAVTKEDFEMDDYDEALIQNKAHQIIYQHIHGQLKALFEGRDTLKAQCESLYQEAYNKYKL